MPDISWYAGRRVILCRLVGEVTIEKARHINDELAAMIDQGEKPVHILFDLSEVGAVPNNLFKLREATHIVTHPGLGWVVVAGIDNPLIQFLGSMVSQLGRLSRYRVLPTIEKAYAHLRQMDDSLPDATAV